MMPKRATLEILDAGEKNVQQEIEVNSGQF